VTAIRLPTPERLKRRSANGILRPAALLLTVGAMAVITGIAVIASSLSPMLGLGDETATVVPPAQTSVSDLGAGFGTPNRISGSLTAPPVVDGPVKDVAFQMRIPALHYSASVLEGVGAGVLAHSPGHYPTTAWPGRAGTVGVAAHNVYWLSFNRLKVGDEVELQTSHGLFVYEITGSKITVASDTAVLQSTAVHTLALTTCYPLWAGAFATKRLVFFAREVGGVS